MLQQSLQLAAKQQSIEPEITRKLLIVLRGKVTEVGPLITLTIQRESYRETDRWPPQDLKSNI